MSGGFRPSLPGERRGGRQKGTPNKVDRTIKEMVVGALNDIGGQEWLARKANEHPVAFMTLVGRVLPLQLAGADGGALIVDFRWADNTNVSTVTIENTSVDTQSGVDTEPEAIDVEWSDGEPQP